MQIEIGSMCAHGALHNDGGSEPPPAGPSAPAVLTLAPPAHPYAIKARMRAQKSLVSSLLKALAALSSTTSPLSCHSTVKSSRTDLSSELSAKNRERDGVAFASCDCFNTSCGRSCFDASL